MRCPYHEDSKPSLLVFDDGLWNCLGCGRRGLNTELYNDLQRTPNVAPEPEAATFFGPKLPTDTLEKSRFAFRAHDMLSRHDSLAWYLKKRGVESRIDPCLLGWHNGWYTIPIIGRGGDVEGLILRAGDHVQKATGLRFTQPSGQTAMLYVPNWHRFRSSKSIAIVYGMFDALSLDELGFPACTTTCGKDSLRPEWFSEYTGKLYLIPDKGEEDTAERHAKLMGKRATVLRLPYRNGIKDPAAFLEEGKRDVLARFLATYL